MSEEGDDELSVNGAPTTTKPDKAELESGSPLTIKFKSGDKSDGETKFKITFKKAGEKDPEVDPNNCKPFYFLWDEKPPKTETDRKIPRRMMDDIGPTVNEKSEKVPRIFRYLGPNQIGGTVGKPSAYINGGLIIQQKKSRSAKYNYFVIG